MPYKKERIKTYITPQGDGNFETVIDCETYVVIIKTYITPQGDGNSISTFGSYFGADKNLYNSARRRKLGGTRSR